MSAHATATINSGFGSFVKGDPLRDVPDATVKAWIDAGLAIVDPEPEPTPEVDAPEAAEVKPRASKPRKTTRKVSSSIDA